MMNDQDEESKILGLTLTQFAIFVCVIITFCLLSLGMMGMTTMGRGGMYGGYGGGYGGYY
jgi:hypothetical protein